MTVQIKDILTREESQRAAPITIEFSAVNGFEDSEVMAQVNYLGSQWFEREYSLDKSKDLREMYQDLSGAVERLKTKDEVLIDSRIISSGKSLLPMVLATLKENLSRVTSKVSYVSLTGDSK